MDLDARNEDRLAARIEHRSGFARGFLELARIRFIKVQMPVPFEDLGGHFDLAVDHVAVNLDIARALFGPYGANDRMQVLRGGSRVGYYARGTGDLVVDASLRFDLAGLVMDERAELALLFPRAAGEDKERHPLGERPGDGIDHVVAAGAVGNAYDADFAGRAGIAVGGEANARFMREGENFEIMFLAQRKEELEGKIAGYAENVTYACFAQIGDQKVANGYVPLHRFISLPQVHCSQKGARA